jgi:hypothetical protein
MKTRSGWFHLRGLLLLSMGFTLGTILCDSAFAGPDSHRASTTAQPHKAQDMSAQKRIVFYVMSSASAIPKPIAYFSNGIPTTTTPMLIIGRGPDSVTR